MKPEDIAAGKIKLSAVGLCGQVDGTQPGATVRLIECEDIEEQSFVLRENGQFVWNSSKYDTLHIYINNYTNREKKLIV